MSQSADRVRRRPPTPLAPSPGLVQVRHIRSSAGGGGGGFFQDEWGSIAAPLILKKAMPSIVAETAKQPRL